MAGRLDGTADRLAGEARPHDLASAPPGWSSSSGLVLWSEIVTTALSGLGQQVGMTGRALRAAASAYEDADEDVRRFR